MKPGDIEHVREKLKLSNIALPSSELERQIHLSAVQQAQYNKSMNGSGFGVGSKITSFASAFASLMITLGTLAMMHHAIQPEAVDPVALTSKTRVLDVEFISLDAPQPKDYRIARPEREFIALIAPTQSQRDRIIRTQELPKADDVLAKMQLPLGSDELGVKYQLQDAFSDIQYLITNNDLTDARSRYYSLVQSCSSCELPTMLEVLLIDSQAPS